MSTARSVLLSAVVVAVISACGGGPPGGQPSPTASPASQPTDLATLPATPGSDDPTPPGAPDPTAAGTPAAVALPDLARIAGGETPAGWKEVRTADGACRMAVPADWDTETMAGAAIAPGFAGQVMMSNDPLANWGSFEDYAESAKAGYFGADKIVLAETDELFVMAAGPSSPDASVLVGRNRGDSVCGVLLTLTANGVAQLLDTGHQILYSLAATD